MPSGDVRGGDKPAARGAGSVTKFEQLNVSYRKRKSKRQGESSDEEEKKNCFALSFVFSLRSFSLPLCLFPFPVPRVLVCLSAHQDQRNALRCGNWNRKTRRKKEPSKIFF